MRLEEAIGGRTPPEGGGRYAANWGFLLAYLVQNDAKELELEGTELTALIIYLVNNLGKILSDEVVEAIKKDHTNFTFWGIHITKLDGKDNRDTKRI